MYNKDDFKDVECYFLDDKLEIAYARAKVLSADDEKGSIVFVHGVCHGAWCWKYFLKYFSARGYNCFAFSLRGHGESKGHIAKLFYGLSSYVKDVNKVVDHCIKKTGCNPFLLGHSMGGAIVQKYIDQYSECIKGAILFAPVTAEGMGKSILETSFSKNGRYTFSTTLGFANKNLKDSNFFVAKYDKDNYQCRITDVEELHDYDEKLCAESYIAMFGLAKYALRNPVDIPVFVIGTSTDAYFPSDSLKKTAKFYNTVPFIFDNLCHDMMLDPDWEKTARAVLEFTDRAGELKDNPDKFVKDLDVLIKL